MLSRIVSHINDKQAKEISKRFCNFPVDFKGFQECETLRVTVVSLSVITEMVNDVV